MTARIAQLTVDVHNVDAMARFWSAALGFEVRMDDDGNAKLYPPSEASEAVNTIWLQRTSEPTPGKIRLHMDLRPVDGDVDIEVDRLLGLGAAHADVGQQADDPFVVLADPEGNEFCVLRREPRRV
jgi:catechol 2,3-dioxygenase-like lactoylglutathione lyase family enzyme